LTHTISSFEDFDFPTESYDLVNAQYSLPFCAPQEFKALFDKITHSLKSGGIFTGQFFGPRDSWNDGRVNMTFLPEGDAREILNNFKIIKFTEEEADKKPSVGSIKHWHIFHIIALKI
jgi:SAM-dependent methyltransferase